MDLKFKIGAALLLFIAALLSAELRWDQWQTWKENPKIYFFEETPMVTTTDAGYFLSQAREYRDGNNAGSFTSKRLYPDNNPSYKAQHNQDYTPEQRLVRATDVSLLSVMIAHVGDVFADGNLVTAGNLMIPYSIFFTTLAIGILFWTVGYPAEGAIAAMGTSICSAFFLRTSMGRIDTDQLILFFVCLCLFFIVLAAREKRLQQMLLLIFCAGVSAFTYAWFHNKNLIILAFFFAIFSGVFLHQRSLKKSIIACGVFAVAIIPIFFIRNTEYAVNFSARFIKDFLTEPTLLFPDTFSTVTELSTVDIFSSLAFVASHPAIGVAGVIGFIIWAVLNPARGIIFLPFFILGLLGIFIGRRFLIFAAPFIWFGIGWIALNSARAFSQFIFNEKRPSAFGKDAIVFGVAGVVIFAIMATSSYTNFNVRPTFSPALTRSFATLKSLPKNTPADNQTPILATWWDYGYYAHFYSGFNILHDGGLQTTPRTHLIARGLSGGNTDDLIQIIKFISTEGNQGITKNSESLDTLNTAIINAQMPDSPLYLMVTHQMGSWLGSIAKLGQFDIGAGRDVSAETLGHYQAIELSCRQQSSTQFQCKKGLLDTKAGTINGKPIISNIIVVKDGFVEAIHPKEGKGPWNLVFFSLSDSKTAGFQLIHETNWDSSFNQLFNAGSYDKERLELVLDDYPIARVYRVRR